jgi:hypothetical protein
VYEPRLRLRFPHGQRQRRGEGLELVGELRPRTPESGEVVVSAVGEDVAAVPTVRICGTAQDLLHRKL